MTATTAKDFWNSLPDLSEAIDLPNPNLPLDIVQQILDMAPPYNESQNSTSQLNIYELGTALEQGKLIREKY